MKPIRTFSVTPSLPPRLEALRALALNLRWAWDQESVALFRQLDPELWEATGHNPIRLLGQISQDKLQRAAEDEVFASRLDQLAAALDAYLGVQNTWYARVVGRQTPLRVAYFSAEFAVTESLPIFAGGLGVLAGDHLKSASDLGIPLVGVGILYAQGYFRQELNERGWQQESYDPIDFHDLPLIREQQEDGQPLLVEIPIADHTAWAQVWRAQVGRVSLYLLDTHIAQNSPADREITSQLYGGDQDLRIRQEIVLGIGGYRALEALGIEPTVYHMNEGHSAFLGLEHVRRYMERHGLSFAEAREAASASLIFTSHTPVAAGHDYFPPELMQRYLGNYAAQLGISWRDFLALGRNAGESEAAPFSMTVLALGLAAHSNGVSELHGAVSRRMWRDIWTNLPEQEIPAVHVTNGVHVRSWVSSDMEALYDRYLGRRWREDAGDPAVWDRARAIPIEELWRTHERRRERLVSYARTRLRRQRERRGAPRAEIEEAMSALDPSALTIGFARRFAPYKRATLLLRDPQRLARLINQPGRPVQFIIAGKAHPRDEAGKELIRQVVAIAREEPFRGRLVVLEDYDMAMARYLVQGCDVWLNTPRRPLEASGTSGMKAAVNGVLNASTLDGWWAEAWAHFRKPDEAIGWAIGRGQDWDDPEEQDRMEAEALYQTIERDIAATFYDRGPDDTPRRWVEMMRISISQLCHFFNANRMVREYTESFYVPTALRTEHLIANDLQAARALAAWKQKLQHEWASIRVEALEPDLPPQVQVGTEIPARARVHLGALSPDDVTVQLYVGRVDPNGHFLDGRPCPMHPIGREGDGAYIYEGNITPAQSGFHGFSVRVLPHHADLITPFLPGFVAWAHNGP